jgi:glycosyltransferase involved in cell wall biosynthesis
LNDKEFQSLLISGRISEGEGDMGYLLPGIENYHQYLPILQREIALLRDIKTFLILFRLFRKEKPDIVHTHLAKAGLVGRLAAFFARVPVRIHTFHGHVFSGYFSPLKTFIFIQIERLLACLSTKIVVISNQIKNDICARYRIVSRGKTALIPLGFDFSDMGNTDIYTGLLRKQCSIPDHALTIGIVGRLTAIKNHGLFIKIAEDMLNSRSDLHFLIIGDGELQPVLKNQVHRAGIQKNVHFLGWIKQIAKIYADIDILLMTSKNEGTPVSIIESLYFGTPVIASNVGGVPDLVEHEKNGFLVNSFEVKDFIIYIDRLIQDRELYRNIAEEGRQTVIEKFDVQRLLADTKNLYRELIQNEGLN